MKKKDASPDNLAEKYFNIAEVMLLVLNADQTVSKINKKGCKVLGYKEKDIVGKNWFDNFLPKDISADVKKVFVKLMAKKIKPVEYYENPVLTKSGEEKLIAWHNTVLKDKSGKITNVLSSGEDITDRKNTQVQLSIKEKFLTNVFDSIQDGISILDSEMNIVRVNKAMERWYSHAMPLIGKKCYEAYHGQSKICKLCPSHRTLKSGKSTYDIVPMTGPDKTIIGWVDLYTFPLLDDETGEIKGVIEYVRDITERKKAEQELKKFKFISNNSNDAHFLSGRDAKFSYVNKAACRMLGYSNDELLNFGVSDVDILYDLSKYQELFDMAQKDVLPPFETINKRKDGTTFPSEITVTGYQIDGEPHMFAALRDISERKEADDLIRQAKYDWEDIFNSITDIITIHDKDFNIIRYNKAAEKVLGLPLLKNVHVKCHKFYHGTDSPPDDCPSCKCLTTKEPFTFETYEPYMGMFVEIRSIPRFDENNQLSGLIHIVRDITKRRKSEEELRLHGELVANMSEGVNLIRAADLAIVYTNSKFDVMTGYETGELIGENISIVNAPGVKSPENITVEISAAIKEKGTWKGEIQNIRKDGTVFLSSASITAFEHQSHGQVFLSVQTDITEQKRIEEEILSVSKFPSENPNPLLRINSNKEIIYFNESFNKLLIDEALLPEDALKILPDNLYTLIDIALELGKPHIMVETRVAGKVISYNIIPVKEHGYVNLYGRDITERKIAEQELKKRVGDLERFYDMAVGREVKMKELKKEVKRLIARLSKYKKD